MAEVRRDQYGRYLVVPPGGGKPTGYTRATTVAKALDDGGGLIPWKATMAMTGMMRRAGLRATFEALLSQHPDKGPWYGSPDSKAAVKELVEECAEAGGSSDRADIGTALHAIIEQINVGGTPTISQESTRADVDAYLATMAKYGITFDPRYVEATFVLDAWKVAGTADGGVMHVPGLGPVIGDLKTGTNLDYSWQAIAIQLAEYAHGDAHYVQGDATDGSRDVRHSMPQVNQDVAVVIHLPAGEARCVIHTVDIAAGWEAFERSMWTRKWRTRRDLSAPLSVHAPAPAPIDLAENLPMVAPLVATLLSIVKALPADRQQVIKDSWPKDFPPLTKPEHWTPELLAQASALVGQASSVAPGTSGADTTSATDVTSKEVDGTGSVERVTEPIPGDHTTLTVDQWNALTPDERAIRLRDGHLPLEMRVPEETLANFQQMIALLPEHQQAWVIEQARAAKLPNLTHGHLWTRERGEQLLAIIKAADVVVMYDWAVLHAASGLTKAAIQREAKTIAEELGIKIPATIERYPVTGLWADQLAAWIRVQMATRASAA